MPFSIRVAADIAEDIQSTTKRSWHWRAASALLERPRNRPWVRRRHFHRAPWPRLRGHDRLRLAGPALPCPERASRVPIPEWHAHKGGNGWRTSAGSAATARRAWQTGMAVSPWTRPRTSSSVISMFQPSSVCSVGVRSSRSALAWAAPASQRVGMVETNGTGAVSLPASGPGKSQFSDPVSPSNDRHRIGGGHDRCLQLPAGLFSEQ